MPGRRCFESPKPGLLAVTLPDQVAKYNSSLGDMRGWAFDKAWMDEYVAWSRHTAQEVYDMVWFCLREAEITAGRDLHDPEPAAPREEAVRARSCPGEAGAEGGDPPRMVLTRGHMRENTANLSPAARAELEEDYAGSRLGRQELSGELLEDVEGALWKGWMLEEEDQDFPRWAHLAWELTEYEEGGSEGQGPEGDVRAGADR
ncbi:hypothetical protein ACIQNG_26110 [Streptomyces sp. NPDC091377]|uniref:hypothetical protein n=1 Tax=Streptomyces sp. NPDC091377 TaxID=3365995 RepID=UPI0037FC2A3E